MKNKFSSDIWFFAIGLTTIILSVFSISVFPAHILDIGYDTFQHPDRLTYAKNLESQKETYKKYGSSASIITTEDGRERISLDGYITLQFGSNDLTVLSEAIIGLFPALFSGKHENAFVLGLASGITAGAAAQAYDSVTVAEINPSTLPIAEQFGSENFLVMDNPRVDIVIQDGVFSLFQNEREYDVIINTVPSPFFFAANKLWTKDFFDEAAKRLNKNGIFMGWVGRNMQEEGFTILNNTLHASFTDCEYVFFDVSYLGFICSNEALAIKRYDDSFWTEPVVARFKPYTNTMSVSDFLSNLLLHSGPATEATEHDLLNSLDLPRLEFIQMNAQTETTELEEFVYESFVIDPFTGGRLSERDLDIRCRVFKVMQPHFKSETCEVISEH